MAASSDSAAPTADTASDPASEAPADASHTEEDASLEESSSSSSASKLGTFAGVYRPTVLTILGLMMYVREGWVVGQTGLLGTLLIIVGMFVITGTSALSLSSITTNIHIGAGGVFSIISKSLGLETGGSIGIPLYLGQALSGALYIYGFTEGWLYLFPEHSPWLVAYSLFLVTFGIAVASSNIAFKVQGVVMIIILVSMGSIVMGVTQFGSGASLHTPQLWGSFEDVSFWVLFAIFFPGATGIKVGASMSGALESPRKSIPRGTLAAVGTAFLVYVGMAVWYSVVADPATLRAERLIVLERAAVGELVLAGLLASTFTATISTMVAAPRVLQALAEQKITPKHRWLGALTDSGEPRNATIATGALVAGALLLGGLDNVAILITMFFLVIYVMINAVVALEQSLGLLSFRPTFAIPRAVPLVGVAASTLALFVVNAVFALVALLIIVALYAYLVRRQLTTPWQTVRSGIFVSLANWASKHVARTLDEPNERAWKPDLLVPVTSRPELDGSFRFLRTLAEPKGSLRIIGVQCTEQDVPTADGLNRLDEVTRTFRNEELLATSSVIKAPTFLEGVEMSASVLRGTAFRPNILFGLAHRHDASTIQGFVDAAHTHDLGLALLYEHPEAALSQERRVNVWVTDQSPEWSLGMRMPNLDLPLLLALQIYHEWNCTLRLATVCRDADEMPNARRFHERLIEDARLPADTESFVMQGNFFDKVSKAPEVDLNIFGVARTADPDAMQRLVEITGTSCLFVRDSGRESALA